MARTSTGHRADADPGFWDEHQPGFRFSSAPVGSPEFFSEVEKHRYHLEPHIPEVVRFDRWGGKDVLEVGCGIGTDAVQFARAGANYVGVDASDGAVDLANRHFQLEGFAGRFIKASATELPLDEESFDLVYSHGALHHMADTEAAVSEIRRVLRPAGVVLVMLYHRSSLNYHFTIMVLRRAMVLTLLSQHAVHLASRLTGEEARLLNGHRTVLRQHGLRYLMDRQLFLSKNTDGPENPLSKVYSRREAGQLFREFTDLQMTTRFLNLRIFPGGGRLARTSLARKLERRIGWHLYVAGHKQ